MKIGQVTVSYKPVVGGAEVYVDLLSSLLTDAGHIVTVYQPDTGLKDSDLKLVPNPNHPGTWQKLIPRLMRFNFSLITNQFSNLRKEDLLIIHYPEHYPVVFWHKKTVVLTHGVNWDFDPTFKKIQRKFLARQAFKSAFKFVANDTNFLREMGMDIKPKEKMFKQITSGKWFIPNSVDTNFFVKTAGLKELKKLNPIIVPRNLSKARGVDLAIDAFELIARKFPHTNLVVVGSSVPVPDSVDYAKELMKKVKKSVFKKRIIFLGSKPWREMRDIYSSALLTLIPTRGNEGTSLAALESMACGTPTITTSVAGLRDLPSIQAKPEAKSIADAIVLTIYNKNKIATQQRLLVEKVYNLDNWKEAWLKIIEG